MFYKVEFLMKKYNLNVATKAKQEYGDFQGYNFTLSVLLYCPVCLYLRYKRKTAMLIFVRNPHLKTTM